MRKIPTITELYNGVLNDLQTEFGFAISRFGRVMLRVTAAVQSVRLKALYLRVADHQRNTFIDTADPEAKGGKLENWGRGKLGRNPYPARAGRYVVAVTGVSGGTIKALTTFKSDDSSKSPGYLFQVTGAYTLSGTSGTVTLRALTAGSVAELAVGNTLTCTKPLVNVNQRVTVSSISVSPLDAEDLEAYRKTAWDAWRAEPQGGASTDYRLWGKDVAGVKQIYPYPYTGHDNEVIIYVEATVADSSDDHGTPPSDMLTAVEAVLETDPDTSIAADERGRRPMGIFLANVVAVTPKEVNITFTGSTGTIPTADQATITAALKEAIDAIRPYVAGLDLPDEKNDVLDVFGMATATRVAVPTSVFTGITITVAGSPVSSYTFEDGDIPYLGSVTYP